MRRAAIVLAAGALLLVPTAGSGLTAPPGSGIGVQVNGDNPPTTFLRLKGKIGATVAALPFSGENQPAGTFTVTGVPSGSTIKAAFLYLTDWIGDDSVSGTFEGVPFDAPAIATDPDQSGIFNLQAYRADVTWQVTGNGSYDFTSSGIELGYVAALAVVYGSSSLEENTIWINEGAESLAADTSTTIFPGAAAPHLRTGAGRLIILTQADDGTSGEVIFFNGKAVGGPIDANLGPFASLFDIDVGSVGSANTAALKTFDDHFGWHLAILSERRQ
jgi:hypothetical protein